MVPRSSLARERGFTLLELALVLVLLGIVSFITLGGGSSGGGSGGSPAITGRSDSTPQMQSLEGLQRRVVDATIQYAIRHYRLPCADTSIPPNGMQGENGDCGDWNSGHQVGRVPFRTLGLAAPGGDDDPLQQALVYAVYRGEGRDTDLAGRQQPAWQRGDPPQRLRGDTPYPGRNDFLRTLHYAAASPLLRNRPYITGDDGRFGILDCDNNAKTNVAFLVASGGLLDAGLDGSLFDGVHRTIPSNPSGELAIRCFAPASASRSMEFDDAVTAMGFNQLAGTLLTTGRR